MVIDPLPLKTTVPVEAVKVPLAFANGEPEVPVKVSVLEPLCENSPPFIVNEVAETDEARFIIGVPGADSIITAPTSCLVELLSVQVLVPSGTKVSVAVPDLVQVVLALSSKLPATFKVVSFVSQSIVTALEASPIIKLSVAIVPAIRA